jgi:chromosome segregation ATPase
MANQINNQVHQLNATKDELQTMEVTVRNYNEKLQYLTEQYEKLDRKDEVLNRITKDVDTSFERLKELEQRLTNANRQIVSLPNEIKEVQTSVDRIIQNGPKITEAVGRLEKLDDLINQTNAQLETIQNTKGGIDKTVMNLSAMNREVDDKFKTLRQITENQIKTEPAASKNNAGIAPAKRDMVRTLKRQGWTIFEIARRVGLTENEVDLILQMPE